MSKDTVTIPKSVLKELVSSSMRMIADFAGMGKKRPPEDYQAVFGYDGATEWLEGINCEDEMDEWESYKRLREQENTLFCKLLFDAGLTRRQISRVIDALDELCPYCKDVPRGCHCSNDE